MNRLSYEESSVMRLARKRVNAACGGWTNSDREIALSISLLEILLHDFDEASARRAHWSLGQLREKIKHCWIEF